MDLPLETARRSLQQRETRGDEVSEIAVVGDDRDVVIDAGLGDEAVGKIGSEASRTQLSTKQTDRLPLSVQDRKQQQIPHRPERYPVIADGSRPQKARLVEA